MAIEIFPGSRHTIESNHAVKINATVNSFGGIYEQRIVHDIPVTRQDGTLRNQKHTGRHELFIRAERLKFESFPVPGNANLNNSIEKIWQFFHDKIFYDSVADAAVWNSFYVYDKVENDDLSTWTGDTPSSGTNSRGQAVTEASGRYKVRLSTPEFSRDLLEGCFFGMGIPVLEVA